MTDITHCPKCQTALEDAPGIGPFCPNRKCDVSDGILSELNLVSPLDDDKREIARLRGLLQATGDERDTYRQAMEEAHSNGDVFEIWAILAKALGA